MKLEVTIDSSGRRRMLTALREKAGVKRVYEILDKEGRKSKNNLREAIGVQYNKSQYHSTGKPRMRSRRLRDAMNYKVVPMNREGRGITLLVGVTDGRLRARIYAKVQEKGRTFRAKGRKLAIPLSEALDSQGRLMFTPRQAKKHFARGVYFRKVNQFVTIMYGRPNRHIRVPIFKLKTTNKVPGIPRKQHEYIRPERDELFDRVKNAMEAMMKEATRRGS